MSTTEQPIECPTCGCTSLQLVTTESGNIAGAAITEFFLGTAAGTTAGRQPNARIVCLKCGYRWEPGSMEEATLRLAKGDLSEKERQWYKNQLVRRSVDDVAQFFQPFFTLAVVMGIALLIIECS
ncbi:MAG: hypothetical protein ACYC2G_06020 [Gemmatimonadaceae bacterium]